MKTKIRFFCNFAYQVAQRIMKSAIDHNPIALQEHKPLTLGKSSKLRHRTLVEGVFADGKGVYEFPLRVVWRALTTEELDSAFRDHRPDRIGKVQMLITVPKKKRRHAVDRVLVRRRIRESFRLCRRELEEALEKGHPDIRTLSMAIIYQSNENLPYGTIEKAMARSLTKIMRRL